MCRVCERDSSDPGPGCKTSEEKKKVSHKLLQEHTMATLSYQTHFPKAPPPSPIFGYVEAKPRMHEPQQPTVDANTHWSSFIHQPCTHSCRLSFFKIVLCLPPKEPVFGDTFPHLYHYTSLALIPSPTVSRLRPVSTLIAPSSALIACAPLTTPLPFGPHHPLQCLHANFMSFIFIHIRI